jgi:hypothetical protein
MSVILVAMLVFKILRQEKIMQVAQIPERHAKIYIKHQKTGKCCIILGN